MKNTSSGQTKKKGTGAIGIILAVAVGAISGICISNFLPDSLSYPQTLLYVALLIVGLYIGMLVQIVIHESGHLVFGLLSGYRFVSFRIGSIILCRQNGKYRIARYSLAGTGGQCLLSPPDLRDGKMPVVLYNLGGVIFNLIFSILFFAIVTILPTWPSILPLGCAISGIIMALINGIPMRTTTVNNDGSNAFHLRKDPEACRALWIQLRINEKQMMGARLRDMPAEWFDMPDCPNLKNSMVSACLVFRCNWLMDCGRLAEADREMKALLEVDSAMAGIYRSLLTLERIYCALIRGDDPDGVTDAWEGAELKQIRRAMKTNPSIIRMQYTYALLAQGNLAEAEKQRKLFDKIAEKYPYQGDLQGERELMLLAEKQAKRTE